MDKYVLKSDIKKTIFFWLTVVCVYSVIMWVNLYVGLMSIAGIIVFGMKWHKYDEISKSEKSHPRT